MNNRALNILLAARSILEASGPPLTSSSDAFTVSRKVLVVHDVAELVLAASTVQVGSGFKLTEQTSFHDLTGYVISKMCGQLTPNEQATLRNRLMELNHVRVRFKHHGDLLDPSTTFPIVTQALEVVDVLSQGLSGSPLTALDAISLVENPQIAVDLREAEGFIKLGEYQSGLISTAKALSLAFWEFDLPNITVGNPNSDNALLLSGRGVDPATFLSMQRFLPRMSLPHDDNPEFKTREYWHEANWTHESAQFCWSTALTLVLRLQHAPPVPQAREFYDEFEDLIEITSTSAIAYRFEGMSFGSHPPPSKEITCTLGELFWGKAQGFYDFNNDKELNYELPLSDANWIRLDSHNLRDTTQLFFFGVDEIWFNAKDVSVTYREGALARMRKEYRASDDDSSQS